MKKKILIGGSAIFVIVLSIYFFLNKVENKPVLYKEKSVYTIEDFKNSNLEKEEADRIINLLNKSYIYLAEKNNPYSRWIDIGLYKKVLGDIDGAKNAWRNAVSLVERPAVAYGNLANLYFYYDKNFVLAEEYYIKAMEISPDSYNYREALSDVYRYGLTDKIDSIEVIMLEGASKEPSSTITYYSYLLEYFTASGNKDKADEYYQKIKSIDPNWESDIQNYEL